ncbi:MAG: sce7726 family protein [Eubacterium sp.]
MEKSGVHVLRSSMLYDKDIREPLFDFLDDMYGINRIIEEKQMGRSRADVVMITPEAVYGIEIKSDADTYSRLKRQVRDYNLFYDYNYIVAGTSHAYHVQEHVPKWWGIITVENENGSPDFYVLRKPDKNPKVKWKRKLGMLWRPELAHIQEINNMPKYRQKSKDFVIDKIIEKIPEEILQFQFCEELMQRDYNEITKIIEAYKR